MFSITYLKGQSVAQHKAIIENLYSFSCLRGYSCSSQSQKPTQGQVESVHISTTHSTQNIFPSTHPTPNLGLPVWPTLHLSMLCSIKHQVLY